MARRFTLVRNRDGNYHVELRNTRGVVPVLTLTTDELAELVAAGRRLLDDPPPAR